MRCPHLYELSFFNRLQKTAGIGTGNIHVSAFSEYVSETGRILDGRGIPAGGILDEQAQTGAAADIWVFPVTVPAYEAAILSKSIDSSNSL